MNPWLRQLLIMAFRNAQAGPRPQPAEPVRRPVPPPPPAPRRIVQTEYLLKGIYLGLALFAALILAAIPPGDEAGPALQGGLLRVNTATLVGLGTAVLIAACLRFRDAVRAKGRFLAFLLFLLLESPTLVYVGIIGGAFVGVYLLRGLPPVEQQPTLEQLFVPIIGGAAVAGLVFGWLRQLRDPTTRILLILVLASTLVAAGLSWLGMADFKFFGSAAKYTLINPAAFATQILLSLPFFYLLTFSGQEEESEVEIGVMSGLLGLGLTILAGPNRQFASLTFLLPVVLYFVYTLRVLPGLRVLKHAFRGFSYARVGRHRRALLAFRRALQLDPANRLARDGFWEVHRSLDFDQLAKDPQTLALVDLDLCLDRAGSLLLSRPAPAQLAEAERLLELVVKLDPGRRPAVCYWTAVARTHAGRIDEAAHNLEQVLDPAHFGEDHPARRAVLFSAWQLALQLHDGLRHRVGLPQLGHAGRRMEAIQTVERQLAAAPDDPPAIAMKKELYADLSVAEYTAGAGGADLAAPYVDHAYLQHLGLGLINDDARWPRGGEYLRLAARGLPEFGPSLFVQIAQALQRAGRFDEARHNYELAKRAGQGVGWTNLEEAQKQAYFATVKYLADEALSRGDVEAAIENYRLYTESERSGIETLRTLAGLYERKGDALAAARATDQALQYNAKDADLLERKDRYYYSIAPEDLQRRLDHYGAGFDVAYCLQKARYIVDKYTDADWLEVAHHLARLALVVKPDSLAAKLLYGRVLLRLGERDQAVGTLEEVRGPQRPERFATGEDEEAWYQASQLLGDLYAELGRADLAVPCLLDFRKSSKSGARTLFKLAQAYEAIGDQPRAKKCYEQVTAYEGNPLTADAREALARLGG